MRSLRSFASLALPSLFIATALAFQLGCSSSTPPEPNLRPASISVVTPAGEIQVSHRLKVEVRIDSVTALQGVGVAYRLFPRAQYDAHHPDTEGHVLGTSLLDVPAGGATFAVDLQVPYEIEPDDDTGLPEPFPAGEYYVVAEVDPRNTIAETDETDQSAAKVSVLIRDEHRNHPRLVIESAVLDIPAFELSWVAGVPPAPLGLTVLVRSEGGDPDAPLPNAEIAACVRGPNTGCVALPVGIWDGAAGRHLPKLVVPQLVPGEPTSVHLDLHVGEELWSVFQALLEQAAQACLANVQACAGAYQANLACVQDCIPDDLAHLDRAELQACLLKCLPFEIVATIDKPSLPGFELFRPSGDAAARTTIAAIQLVAPPPADPSVPPAVKVWPVGEPVVDPCQGSPLLPALEFVAERVNCAEDVLWSVRFAEEYPVGGGYYADRGRVAGTNLGALYWTPWCETSARQTKVVVEAAACGTTSSTVVTLLGLNPSVAVKPPAVAVTTGADGAAEFTAALTECSALVVWTLEGGDPARLVAGPGTVEVSPSTLTASYRPPPRITIGPPVEVTLRASAGAPCLAEGTATIAVGLPTKLEFEKAYAKTFANSLFGAGVDLYAGAFLDRDGGRAKAHAVVPVKVFGQSFDLLRVTDDAGVNPRPPIASHFDHRFELFGKVEHELHCPGDAICTGTAELWSKDWCVPGGPPPVCIGSAYDQLCKRTTDCPSGLRCLYGTCTQKCDEPDDCSSGNDGVCLGSLTPGPYKKVFVVVVVPVTVEGRVCAEVGIQASVDLLRTPNTFEAKLGPYFEAGGYASAAAGYSGLLALGVRGEVVLVRDDFYGGAQATIELVDLGPYCPYPAGCIRGALREGVENVLQGGEGQIYLFADYPTLKWCKWYPCIRTARAKLPIVNWGSLFEVEWTCDWCTSNAQCPLGVQCVDGRCDDGRPGLLCLEQSAFVSAE
ncbi:MAG TPA: hypothetical protein VFR85_12115 [Anaeromyxobacteraceae bacterium]|nr:hypothetical protein [Anaeromyxobacteraceae bacterium]